ncbi:MAG: Wzt carbohydrate-binding domain-containing protein, partial [bacterium]
QQESIQKIDTARTPVRWGSFEAEFTRVRIFDAQQQERYIFLPGEQIEIELEYIAHRPIPNPYFGIGIDTEDKIYITGGNTKIKNMPVGTISGKGKLRIVYPKLNVTGGKFLVTAGIFRDPDNQDSAYDYYMNCASFFVDSSELRDEGVVFSPQTWEFK